MSQESHGRGAPDPREEHRLSVGEPEAGSRLDRFLASRLSISRKAATEAIEGGQVSVSGRKARKSHLVSAGDEVLAVLPPAGEGPVPQPELPLIVSYEDADLVVVEKPGGWPTHPLRRGETNTLANAIVGRWPECVEASTDPREGGVAHRLDTPTSGLVIAAKNRHTWERLRQQFSDRSVTKEYLALVVGDYSGPSKIETPIASEGGSPLRMVAVDSPVLAERQGAREAYTSVSIVKRFEKATLVRCVITTGVMHQIRVHLAHAGHPVAGDPLYGDTMNPPGIPRLFLHAALLAFEHPSSGWRVVFESTLPGDLQMVLDSLQG